VKVKYLAIFMILGIFKQNRWYRCKPINKIKRVTIIITITPENLVT
jgi:hypothetical protein